MSTGQEIKQFMEEAFKLGCQFSEEMRGPDQSKRGQAEATREYYKYKAEKAAQEIMSTEQKLREALQMLIMYAEDSNGCQYGTLSATVVKEIAEQALAAEQEQITLDGNHSCNA